MSAIHIEDNSDDSWSTLPLTLNSSKPNLSVTTKGEYENNLKRYKELSNAIRNRAVVELGVIGDRYRDLNGKIQEYVKFRNRLERREAELKEADDKLSVEFALFEKWRETAKEKSKEKCDYNERLNEIEKMESSLKENFAKLNNCEEILKEKISNYTVSYTHLTLPTICSV
eukprot:TRINITY_DN24469_c0_g1_i1.p1 TRINITY_DN24469_c0_g1~~TRINITY_DN24469_c0_g1_i1.p1  ORF type:complete len:171 (+),score=38.98 TRINITY_DN24469_c0_g1_i1:182-694(+)